LEKASYAMATSNLSEGGTAMNFSFPKRELAVLAVLFLATGIVRILLFPLQGYPVDTGDFISWFNTATQHGIRPFYSLAGFADYPPFNVYVFWVFGSVANALGISMASMVKVVPNLFDLATGLLIYVFARRQTTFKIALLSGAFYLFNPAVIFNVAVWGQYDAVYTFFLVLSLFLALKSKPELSAAAFALAILTKPQGIAIVPLIILLIFKKNRIKRLLTSVLAFAGTVFLVILPFEWSNPVSFLSGIYFGAYSGYAFTSINAFNLWGLFGLWVPDGSLFIVGWGLFGVATAFTLYVLHKRFNLSGDYLAIFAAFMLLFSFFMLPTRIHERYMFPAMAMLALMFPLLKKTRLLYGVLTATLFINEAYVLYALNAAYPNFADLTRDPVVPLVSAINLLMLVYASILLWYELKGRKWLKAEPAPTAIKQPPERGETASTST
jgi:dolichyl-phosphate-mannose-protein mannosyltransferase